MKKITIILIFLFFISSCSNQDDIKKIEELEKENNILKLNIKNDSGELNMKLDMFTFNKLNLPIKKLNCVWNYNSSLVLSEKIWKSNWTISTNSEKFELNYLWKNNISMFWTNFNILLDNKDFLIAVRLYEQSGLTEILHLNKNNWYLIDSKTYSNWIHNAPASFDTVFTCNN